MPDILFSNEARPLRDRGFLKEFANAKLKPSSDGGGC